MKIIVTGAAGFIGANILRALNERGESDILAVDNLARSEKFRNLAEFDIADYITTTYQGDEYIHQVMTGFADYVKQETLSTVISEQAPEEGAYSESFKLDGHQVLLGVKRKI